MDLSLLARSRATAARVGFVACLSTSACTPTGELGVSNASNTTSPSTSDAKALADARAPQDASIDAASDGGDSAVARYFQRKWSIRRDDDKLVFEAPGTSQCAPLPAVRPRDFSLILVKRGGKINGWSYWGVSAEYPCRFPWSMPWAKPPPAACRAIGAESFDRLYTKLLSLSPHTLRTRKPEHVSPHRGGFGILMRYSQTECDISDILENEVLDADRERFEAVQDLIRSEYDSEPTQGSSKAPRSR